ncbi:uncharacterized [Tachysurus ichikawai]
MATASFCLHSGRPRVDPRRSCHPADRLDFMRRITRSQRANTILNTSLSTRPGRLLSDKTPVTVPLCYQIKASVLEGWEMKKTRVQTDEPRGQPDLISIHIQSDKGFQMMLFKCAASQVAQSPDQCWGLQVGMSLDCKKVGVALDCKKVGVALDYRLMWAANRWVCLDCKQVGVSLGCEQVGVSLGCEQVGVSLGYEQVGVSLGCEQAGVSLDCEKAAVSCLWACL